MESTIHKQLWEKTEERISDVLLTDASGSCEALESLEREIDPILNFLHHLFFVENLSAQEIRKLLNLPKKRFNTQKEIIKAFFEDVKKLNFSDQFDEIRKELQEKGITYEPCLNTFKKIDHIIKVYILEVAIVKDYLDLKKKIDQLLATARWHESVYLPYYRHLKPDLYKIYLQTLKSHLSGLKLLMTFRMEFSAIEIDWHIKTAVEALLGEMKQTIQKAEQTFDTEAVLFPGHIFASATDYYFFKNINQHISLLPDLTYVFRIMKKKNQITCQETTFRNWYQQWELRVRGISVDSYFKSLSQVSIPSRINKFKYYGLKKSERESFSKQLVSH